MSQITTARLALKALSVTAFRSRLREAHLFH